MESLFGLQQGPVQTLPMRQYETSSAGIGISNATVADVFLVRKCIRKLNNTSISLTYVPLHDLTKCKLVVFCDASHSSKSKEISQGGHVIFIADSLGNANILRWQSKKISRICKSTIAAETISLLEAVETAYFLKLLFEDITGRSGMDIICYSDNKSLVQHLKTTNTVTDFRLRVDISRLREMLDNGEITDVRWVSTDRKLADCLTKSGASAANLLHVLKTNSISEFW